MATYVTIIPTAAKICVWICLAHFYVIICSIVYVELEGFTNRTDSLAHLEGFMVRTFSGNAKKLSQKVRQQHSEKYEEFQKGFDKEMIHLHYWQMRNEFNDISKVYVYVLGLYTTVGTSRMYIQTWQSKLFYCFTVPLGILFYFMMLHSIAVELFEIIAYSAVSILPRQDENWNDDQRDLYEKIKCVLLIFVLLVSLYWLFSLLSILTHSSYLDGMYAMLSLILGISYNGELLSFDDWEHHVVAACLTVVYFISMLTFHLFVYSIFILFRYNNLHDMLELLFPRKHNFFDIVTAGDSEYEEMHHRHERMAYYQAKISSQDFKEMRQDTPGCHATQYGPMYPFTNIKNLSDSTHSLSEDDKKLLKPRRKKKKRKSGVQRQSCREQLPRQQFVNKHVPYIEVTGPSASSSSSQDYSIAFSESVIDSDEVLSVRDNGDGYNTM